jgi:hypothetical protein
MTDPRPELRSALARWFVLRAKVRALADALTAREHGVQRDLRASPDARAAAILRDQLQAERSALDELAAEIDERIDAVKGQTDALETAFIVQVAAHARSRAPARG